VTAKKYLFVGGVHDGDWLEVPGDPPPFVLRFHKYPSPLPPGPYDFVRGREIEEYRYEVLAIAAVGHRGLYVLDGFNSWADSDAIIGRLLAGPPGDRPVTCEPDHVVG
jgi:hypothetical protein